MSFVFFFFFFFNDTATTEIYTLSLHDALPICGADFAGESKCAQGGNRSRQRSATDRKSTRLNSSHSQISYAVFCLKKKKDTAHCVLYHLSRINLREHSAHYCITR